MNYERMHLSAALVSAIRVVLEREGYEPRLASGAEAALRNLVTDATGHQVCRTCAADKLLSEFYVACGRPETICKSCRVARAQKSRKETGWQRSPEGQEKARERQRARAKDHPELKVEGMRQWRKRHPEQSRLMHRIAAQLRRTPGLRASIFARDGHRCLACGATANLVIDHILPVLRGGTNDPVNLQTLCRSCNSKKRGAVDHRRLT